MSMHKKNTRSSNLENYDLPHDDHGYIDFQILIQNFVLKKNWFEELLKEVKR